MNAAVVSGFELINLPPLDPQRARALFPLVIERLMTMNLPEDQATLFFRNLLEPLLQLLSHSESGQAADHSWKEWFDFCESFRAEVPVQSYQDILDDPDRW
jgi:hypothetical protein